MSNPKLHPHFRLNSKSYSETELKQFAKHLIQAEEPFERAIGQFILDWLNGSHEVAVTTSGSTGKPKQLMLQKKYMLNSALATGTFFKCKEGTKALLCLPAAYIAGKMMLVRAMVLGWHLDYVLPNSKPIETTSKLYDFAAMVPLQVQNSIDKLSSIKRLIVGGAAVSKELKKQLLKVETEVFETYGMTETITHIAAKRITTKSATGDTHFKTLPNVTIALDGRGCLTIDASKISDEKVITNDLVEIISETTFQWLGRFDNVINSGGIKLIPEQIETKLSTVISNRLFVIGIPDEQLGQKLVLVAEGEGEMEKVQTEIKSLTTLTKYEVPKEIYFVKNFVETETGKVQRQKTWLSK